MLAFEVKGRLVAVPVHRVREVARAVRVVPLPGAAATVDGAITVRGEAVPVVDLARALGLPATPPDPDEHLILVAAGTRTAALRVERVLALRTVDERQVDTPAGFAPGLRYVADPDAPLVLVDDAAAFLGDRLP